jgi:hypothetical protein
MREPGLAVPGERLQQSRFVAHARVTQLLRESNQEQTAGQGAGLACLPTPRRSGNHEKSWPVAGTGGNSQV